MQLELKAHVDGCHFLFVIEVREPAPGNHELQLEADFGSISVPVHDQGT